MQLSAIRFEPTQFGLHLARQETGIREFFRSTVNNGEPVPI